QNIERQDRQRYGQAGFIWSRQFFDGLGRTYREERKAAGGRTIVSETMYDKVGRIGRISVPHFAAMSSPQLWTAFEYDGLTRPTKAMFPDGTTTLTSYKGWTTTTKDANGQTQSSEEDAYGRVVARYEATIGTPTMYSFDALGRLTKVQDNNGAVSTLAYDSLG